MPVTRFQRTTIAVLLLLVASVARAAWAAPAYPLRLAPGGRNIVDQAGKPVFFVADSPWHLIARLTREDATLYLDDRAARGFNALLMSLIVPVGYSTGNSNNAYGAGPFVPTGNFAAPNEAYFAHADWVLQQAETRGFTVFLAPAYVGYECNNSGWCAEMRQAGTTVLRNYGRWVGARYRDQPNIVWVEGGDVDAAAYGALDLVDAVAYGIRDNDPNHLHTAHCRRFSSALDCYNRPWLDFNTTYADCVQSPLELHTDYLRAPARPFVLIEGRYEFESNWTPQCLRAQAYWSLLGGAVGEFFGVGPIWDFTTGWQTALDSQGAHAMAAFRRLLRSRRWGAVEPDVAHSLLTAGYGDMATADFAAAALVASGNSAVIYTPSRRSLSVDLSRIAGSTVSAWWFDPADGSSQALGSLSTTGTHTFLPPADHDWVLVLDNEALGFGAPGQGDVSTPSQTRGWGTLKGEFRTR